MVLEEERGWNRDSLGAVEVLAVGTQNHGHMVPGALQTCRCSSPWYKMTLYLHITYTHAPECFKSSPNDVEDLVEYTWL